MMQQSLKNKYGEYDPVI
jgi:hypothetical protein